MDVLKKNSKKQCEKNQKSIEKQLTFTKIAISFVLINSELQIWASYVLAFLGRDSIAEALSQQIVITIIGTMVAYFVKSLVENLSKYTTLFNKKHIEDNITQYGMQPNIGNDAFDQSVEINGNQMCDGIVPVDTDIESMI